MIEQPGAPAIGERVLSLLRSRFAGLKGPLSTVQTVVGLITGIVSIGGALLGIPGFFAAAPNKGEVVAIVQEAKTEKAVTDATIEILTSQNAVVTMLTSNYFGKARYWVNEGQYRVRVSHPRFAAEIRQVQVVPGQTAEIRVQLRAGASSTVRQAERVVDEGVDTIRRLFGR